MLPIDRESQDTMANLASVSMYDAKNAKIQAGRIKGPQVDVTMRRQQSRPRILTHSGTGEKWPDTVVLHLYLKGLENFSVRNGKVKVEVTVSSQDGKVRLWKDEKEDSPLDATNPYWMNIRMVGNDGKPAKTIPLKDGYFEMQLPKAFIEENPKSITVNWIDFYRN